MAQSFESSAANISFRFPMQEERPINRQTFLLIGFGVTLGGAPTTSEAMVLDLDMGGDYPSELEVVQRDLMGVVDWLHLIDDGPIPLTQETLARISYPNSDRNSVNITFLGYWI